MAASLHPGLRIIDRIGWSVAALAGALRFARRAGLDRNAIPQLYVDCLMSGATPPEAVVWRGLHGSRHPLPGRAAGLLLSRLGDPAGHALLADKLAAAAHLSAAGLAVPTLHLLVEGPSSLGGTDPPLPVAGDLFVKPRRGSGGRGSFALIRESDGWRIGEGTPPMPWTILRRLLLERSARDPLLVQERLSAHPDLADLAAAGRPPVLRLTTTREPGGAPILHAALVEIPVPGRDPRRFRDGVLRVPVDPSSGRMTAGLSFAQPGERFAALPWNGAGLTGRVVPGYAEAAAAVVEAMRTMPPLPIVDWDLVPTPRGPVVLEGNTCGNWIVTTLASRLGLGAGPPPGRILAAWDAIDWDAHGWDAASRDRAGPDAAG
ncbi:Sugar-transfer associated ATP-grasp [Methylobacterium sp. 174MFSha1.1]|uniref:sugar-transfer associated ATP-grasp domain-containing protein n=1 Tax=Methylobacterium sp. 174MFSha1.1 TaxID=1502749 RepID=UPI0008E886B1|nr:sugar-transfer associated ATP-grasp domain-containing protein [Methylobacterium sp. 174MFSha1.1]SFU47346.1 Sugar-transfer associated ATP-grasp [Methylobacterium sp. 174MFSha1.1]